jgi:putative sigma-54 modulation protein
MQIDMSFRHMDNSEATKEYTRARCETLKRYFDGRVHLVWTFSAEKLQRIAHCHLLGNNMDYFGEASTEDMKGSIDLVIDKIEKQVRKHKEIVKDHLHRGAADRKQVAGE